MTGLALVRTSSHTIIVLISADPFSVSNAAIPGNGASHYRPDLRLNMLMETLLVACIRGSCDLDEILSRSYRTLLDRGLACVMEKLYNLFNKI
jgi:hypothetical protein